MNYYSDPYREVITRLLNENKYLKSEKVEENEKLENTINILHKKTEELKEKNTILEDELKEVKSDNKLLSLQIEKFEKIKETHYFSI